MSYYAYILFSDLIKKYYTGSCENPESRLHYHNSGWSQYTKQGVPWRIVKTFEVADKKSGRELENKIKKRGAKRYLDDLEGK